MILFDFPSSAFSAMWSFWEGFRRDPYNRAFFWFLIFALFSSAKWDHLPDSWKHYLCSEHYHFCWPQVLSLPFLLVIAALFHWEDIRHPSRRKNMSDTSEGKRFCLEYQYTLVLLLLFIPLVNRVEQFGWFQHVEAALLDTFILGQPHTIPGNIFIIEITDDDYKQLFNETSPLAPVTVMELIGSVQQGNPAVIGVDLDTRLKDWNGPSLWKHKGDKDDKATLLDDKIVWAEVPNKVTPPADPEQEPTVTLDCVLGGHQPSPRQVGIVLFQLDVDGVVRRLDARYRVAGPAPLCLTKARDEIPSFYHAVYQAGAKMDYAVEKKGIAHAIERLVGRIWWPIRPLASLLCKAHGGFCAVEPKKYFSFSGDRYSFQIVQASEFLNCFDAEGKPVESEPHNFKSLEPTKLTLEQSKLLNGNIVLIGGNFAAARDRYMTPLGEMAGVEVIANAIESDQRHIHEAQTWMLWLADWALGSWIFLVYFKWRDSPGVALVFSLLSILGLLVPAAFAFYRLETWLNVAPVMGGVLIHEMCESTHSSQELLAAAPPPSPPG